MVEKKEKRSIAQIKGLINGILSKGSKASKLIKQLEGLIQYKDILFYTWKLLRKTLEANKGGNEIFMTNVLDLIEKISPPKNLNAQEKVQSSELGLHKGTKKFVLDVPALKKNIRKVWETLINRDLSPVTHRKLLFVLLESYLSNLDNPIFLTDFLMSSTNVKGVISILALQGMATLMQKHNIEYPNIFAKLYTMFEPNIFHAKFKSRLFYLADIFLSSTYLPEIMVASFIKRASRLSLSCSAPDIPMILRFVGNLLMRHTGLMKMIHHPTEKELSEDPFLMNEEDPTKTRASESSLWEISLLQNHCQPSIATEAKFIDSNLPSVEFDMREVLSKSYEEMFDECKKKIGKPSVTFERPQQTIRKLKSDQLYKLWSLTE